MSYTLPSLLITLAKVSTAAPAIAWICARFLRNQSASLRHAVWVVAICAPTLALPMLVFEIEIEVPVWPAQTLPSGRTTVPLGPKFQARVDKPTPHAEVSTTETLVSIYSPSEYPPVNLWLVIWLSGVILAGGKMAVDRLRISLFVRRQCRGVSHERRGQLHGLTGSSALPSAVIIWTGPFSQIPFCFGILEPEIVLPDAKADPDSERRLIICLKHELAHIARHDLLWLFLGYLSCAACWFNPLMWIGMNQLKIEAELAADDQVIAGGVFPTDYAKVLVEMVRLYQESLAVTHAIGMISASGGVVSRVRRCLDPRICRHTPNRRQLGWMSAGIYCALGLILGVRLVEGAPSAVTPQELADALASHQYSATNFHLTINPVCQGYIEKALQLRKNDAAVLVDVGTGDIVALGGSYGQAVHPCSTFNPVTTLAAIRAGVFDPSRAVHCTGSIPLHYGDHEYVFLLEHGNILFTEAFSHSYFTYFADLGQRVGGQSEIETARELGLGVPTGLGLSESAGSVPDADALSESDLADIAIGQGKVLVTPLQMANVMATLANGGTLNRLRLMREVPVQKVRLISMSNSNTKYLKSAMIQLVESGTATNIRRSDVQIAGQTGTQQMMNGSANGQIAWFCGYFPADKPKYAFAVMVNGTSTTGERLYGASDAGAIARALIDAVVANKTLLVTP